MSFKGNIVHGLCRELTAFRLSLLRVNSLILTHRHFSAAASNIRKLEHLVPKGRISEKPESFGQVPNETLTVVSSPNSSLCISPTENYAIGSAEWRDKINDMRIKNVTLVRNARDAAEVLNKLCSLHPRAVVAWDTETTRIDPRKQSPIGNGSLICLTGYAGEDIDFGNGPRLFVDCLDGEEGVKLLQNFKVYFESNQFKKCWHNYSFDRHILANHGIHSQGFHGDTMHLARLFDTSRKRYSLEELVRDYLRIDGLEKRNMVTRFGRRRKLKNGDESKEIFVPDTITLQRNIQYRTDWIDYSTRDAELTYKLYDFFINKLASMKIDGTNCVDGFNDIYQSLFCVYWKWMLPFGEMLTDMERFGFKVDVELLKIADSAADRDRLALESSFRSWAESKCVGAEYMNVHSDRQKQQLLFAPCRNKKNPELRMEASKTFVVEQSGIQAANLQAELEEKKGEIRRRHSSEKSLKMRKLKKDVVLHGLGKTPTEYTVSGWPSVSASALNKLAGRPRAQPPVYGDPSDPEMCRAIADVVEASSIVSLQSNFIVPLQSWPGKDGRIHASLNLNTETGRLSSRRPNLQNQPALDKDRYRIREAFVCEPGNRLIVADYGQLELRLMAHMTNCVSMIEAFESGGDFHSRTAMTMFDHVAHAVESGECLVERTGFENENQELLPLVKEKFVSERRKAKTLNFSIAYGKTVVGLAKDWNVDFDEALKTLNLWYKERQEVRRWQQGCRDSAAKKGYVETILGRRRHLPDAKSKNSRVRAHAERAAINAPLQGSAADLVMAAMLKLHEHGTLKALGWRVIMQVHDEIILEGPEHSAEIALPIVCEVMHQPFDFLLRVQLAIDAKICTSWYDGK